MIFIILIALLAIWLPLYHYLYPRENCIYKDSHGNKAKVTKVKNFVATLVFILDDGQEVTSPQNWDLVEFIKTFTLWKEL